MIYSTNALLEVQETCQATWLLYLQHCRELEWIARLEFERLTQPTLHRMPVISVDETIAANTPQDMLRKMIDLYDHFLETETESARESKNRDLDDVIESGAKVSGYKAVLEALRAIQNDTGPFRVAVISQGEKLEKLITKQKDVYTIARDNVLDAACDALFQNFLGVE